jgi:hypothetical protein
VDARFQHPDRTTPTSVGAREVGSNLAAGDQWIAWCIVVVIETAPVASLGSASLPFAESRSRERTEW